MNGEPCALGDIISNMGNYNKCFFKCIMQFLLLGKCVLFFPQPLKADRMSSRSCNLVM